ncbi:DUF92 domain-containing protein [Mycolicibacter longobardus]|uniref:DUF92 domain-containing protein n=1 Tax=Mycolicibacter longobardus TaxID=1108812 RepID=A0A1X1YIP2_9MYCO|nr:DUF92 domain-containing protein [Mycolicibacter longobardus]MCV7384920.1 DUF92 domain-containing protein [Mycolicibacter longobardus]ORW10924.1 hypothetical protein AWC16_12695 [Mycolicibacter longobardus]
MTATVSHDLAVAGGGILLIAAVLIVVGRALVRRGAGPLVTRKIPHALCGLFAALAAFQLSNGAVVAGVLAAATVALAFIVERGLVPVPGVFDGTRSRDYGLVGFAGGALVAVLAFWPDRVAIAAGVVVLGLADAGAALVGDRYGRHRVEAGGGVRSIEGSVAFVAIAFVVSMVFCRVGLELNTFMAVSVSLFVALTTAGVELLVAPAADNLLITPWVALLLHVARDLSTDDALRWLAAVVFGCAIVPFMLRMRWLDLPGALCGGLIAGVAVGLGGWGWIIPAAVFFSLTSVLTAYKRPIRATGMRTMSQVAVNAGLPVLLPVIGYAFTRDPVWYAVSIGGIAAGIADSWASEIGRFSSREPWSLRTRGRVPKGTSGAVSPLGSGATVLGALAVGTFGALFGGVAMVPVGLAAGVVGSLVDTLIGATVQARFVCATCGATVEDDLHCGAPTRASTGWRWMGNDAVNACANATGMVVGSVVFWLIGA